MWMIDLLLTTRILLGFYYLNFSPSIFPFLLCCSSPFYTTFPTLFESVSPIKQDSFVKLVN